MSKTTADKTARRRRIRLVDVAHETGVSLATVARVLNGARGNIRVSSKTSQKVIRAANKLGYIPNFAASQLAGGSSRMFGAIIDTHAPWAKYSQLAAVTSALKERKLDLLIMQVHDDMKAMQQHSRTFQARGIEGVICFAHDYPGTNTDFRQMFTGFKHVIFVDAPAVVDQEVHFVGLDHADAARQAVSHLCQTGRNKIAFLSLGSMAYNVIRDFVGGYRAGLAENGIAFDHNLLRCLGVSNEPASSVNLAMQDLLGKHKVDALFATCGRSAVFAAKYLKNTGLSVPGDVAIVGIDDSSLSECYEPSITGFTWSNDEIGRRISDMAVQMYNGQEVQQKQILVKANLVPRESTAL